MWFIICAALHRLKVALKLTIFLISRTDTGTVYVKGAEVVGLYRTLLGTEGFKKGLQLYFDRFDGKAVTCDDFRQAMAGECIIWRNNPFRVVFLSLFALLFR